MYDHYAPREVMLKCSPSFLSTNEEKVELCVGDSIVGQQRYGDGTDIYVNFLIKVCFWFVELNFYPFPELIRK